MAREGYDGALKDDNVDVWNGSRAMVLFYYYLSFVVNDIPFGVTLNFESFNVL